MSDPCKTELGTWSHLIDKVLKEHLRWESMANRRHPITKAMILYWINKAKTAHPDSLISALADWMVLGHYAGFRKQEWKKDKQVFDEKNDFHCNVYGSVKAFLMSDFIFRGKRNRRIRNDHKHTIKTLNPCL